MRDKGIFSTQTEADPGGTRVCWRIECDGETRKVMRASVRHRRGNGAIPDQRDIRFLGSNDRFGIGRHPAKSPPRLE